MRAVGWRIRASLALRLTFRAIPADISFVSIYARDFERGQSQFVTTGTYRRSWLFTCQRFCWTFVETLRQLRQETGSLLLGWVSPFFPAKTAQRFYGRNNASRSRRPCTTRMTHTPGSVMR